jgi:hypothetical protein
VSLPVFLVRVLSPGRRLTWIQQNKREIQRITRVNESHTG